jgi:UDP-GlcNAc:undecaprenyl-phosphate GlcNAc-1-phosphate transferase
MSGLVFVVAFSLGILTTLLLVPAVKRLAFIAGALDKPNARKVHQVPMPLWGGLGVFFGFLITLGVMLVAFEPLRAALTPRLSQHLMGMLLAGGLIVVVGLVDDRFGMPAKVKLLCQILIGSLMIWFGIRIDYLSLPLLGVVFLEPWQGVLLTLFWIVGITNALNLLDGLDGLLAGVALTTALVFLGVSLLKGQVVVALVMATLAGCALGFLRYNFNPAQIFMGDTGSLFFGIMFAGWSVVGLLKSTATLALIVPVCLMGVPILDTSMAIIRRSLSGRPIFQPDKEHLHHRLLGLGLTQRQVVAVIYFINILFGLAGLALALAVK